MKDFCKKHFYKQNQAEVSFKIIIITGIKRSSKKNKYYK